MIGTNGAYTSNVKHVKNTVIDKLRVLYPNTTIYIEGIPPFTTNSQSGYSSPADFLRLSIAYNNELKDILKICNGKLISGNENTIITDIERNTKNIEKIEKTLKKETNHEKNCSSRICKAHCPCRCEHSEGSGSADLCRPGSA